MLFFISFRLVAMHEEAVREGSREKGKYKVVREGSREKGRYKVVREGSREKGSYKVVREGSREKGSYKVVREGSRERGKDIRRRSFSSFSPPIFRGAQERSTD